VTVVFDWSINVGQLLMILITAASGLGFIYTLRDDQKANGKRLEAVETEIRKLGELVVKLAVQDERLTSHSIRIDRLDTRLDAIEHPHFSRGIVDG
jgi:hypothetical protein